MSRVKDCHIGKKFGKLTIISELEPIRDNSGSLRRVVEVLCGNTSTKKLKYLKSEETTSCGSGKCKKLLVGKTPKGVNIYESEITEDEELLIGRRYGRLLITNAGYSHGKKRFLKATCDCETEYFVNKSLVLSGHTTSCGCFRDELTGSRNRKHGMCDTETYAVWCGIAQRCTNPNNPSFDSYCGRGINICEDWLYFENFLNDMGERPEGLTIERLDVNKGYFPDNCIWEGRHEQSVNRRKFKNNTSGKTGVYQNKKTGHWLAKISVKGETISLGTYANIEDAVSARQAAELTYFGFNKE